LNFFPYSIFNSIDIVNFSEEKREEDRNVIETFLFDPVSKSVEPEVDRLVQEQTAALKESARPVKEQSTSGSFLSMILREQDRHVVAHINPVRKREEKLTEMKIKIRSEIDKYFLHCRSIDWVKTLEDHPTENYVKEEVQAVLMENNTQLKNPLYLAHRFDVLAWWRKVGSIMFPFMSVGAPIILAKPAHNGYQERVFSLGKFCDSPLRNKQTAANFEMRVLDTINKNNKCFENFNATYIDQKDLFVKNFFQYENVAKILSPEEVPPTTITIQNDDDVDSTVENQQPDPESDCLSEDDEEIIELDKIDNSISIMDKDDDYLTMYDTMEEVEKQELTIQL
jgi:hypothetical protein